MRFIYTKTFVRVFTVFVILAVLAIFDINGYLGWFKDGFVRVFGTASSKVTQGTDSVKNVFSTLFTIKKLVSENATLNQKIDDLSFENARLKSAQDENLALRKALNFTQQSNLNLLPAEVLVLDPTGIARSMTINRGEKSGVTVNQAVVVSPGLLIGKVVKVNPNSSEVVLITDPSMVVNGEVVDSGAKGLVRGEHGLGLTFDMVTQNELIKSGDKVVTSGLSGDFSRGLLIGEIASLKSNSTQLFQKAYISPAADLKNLRFVFVVQ